LILKYSTRKTEVTVGNGLEDFFANIETDKCALTNCFMRVEGCGARYTGDNIKMSTSRPWSIAARVDIRRGYDETVCVECTNNN
jgi:hypothetical protein